MDNLPALVISDGPDRINFLNHHIRSHGIKPLRYPNHGSAMHALKVDAFSVVVVDLTLPVDQKIGLLKAACELQKHAAVFAIGKTPFLKDTGMLKDFPSLNPVPDIKQFPEMLAAQEILGAK